MCLVLAAKHVQVKPCNRHLLTIEQYFARKSFSAIVDTDAFLSCSQLRRGVAGRVFILLRGCVA